MRRMWRVECEFDHSCRNWAVGRDTPPLTLQHDKNDDVITRVRVEWNEQASCVCIVICEGRAYVRRGARPFLAFSAPGRVDVPAARLGTLAVALDGAWRQCYRFRCTDGREPNQDATWSVREHVGLWLQRTFPAPPLRRRLWRALRRYADWSEEGLCTAAARAVADPASGAWREFERLYLQLDRQATPCSPYCHLSADLMPPGGGVLVDLAWISPDDKKRFQVTDWMIGLCQRLRLDDAVLHRAVHLLDLVMHRDPVPISNLTELAAAALVLASKYEDVECIIASDIEEEDRTLTAKAVSQMEWHAARALDYRVGGGTARCWALHLLLGSTYDARELSYVLDRALLDGKMLSLSRPVLAQQIVWRLREGAQKMDDCPSDAVLCLQKHATYLGLEPLMHT